MTASPAVSTRGLATAAIGSAGKKCRQIAARVQAAVDQCVRLALRQTERRCRGQNQMARPAFEFREWTDYLSPPLSLAPRRIGNERQVGQSPSNLQCFCSRL